MTTAPRSAPDPPKRGGRRSPFRRLVLAAVRSVEVGVVGLFVAGVAARYVPPPTLWGLQIVAVAAPYLAFAVGGAAVGAAIGRRWVPASAYALLLGLGHVLALRAGSDPRALQQEAASEAGPRLSVMTFNAKPSAAGPSQEAMAEVLASHRPHLVALQEFPVRTFRDTGATAGPPLLVPLLAGGTYRVAAVAASDAEGGAHRTRRVTAIVRPIFARIEAAAPAQVLAGEPAEGLWASGGVTRAEYEWDGRTVAVYSVHLHSFSGKRPWEDGLRQAVSLSAWRAALRAYRADFRQRAAQARRLRDMLDAEPYPYIACGDLNSTANNWVYGHVTAGLTDAFRVAGGGWGMTFPAGLPLVRIDFVLASRHWDVHEAHVETRVSSDHRPVIAQLSLRP